MITRARTMAQVNGRLLRSYEQCVRKIPVERDFRPWLVAAQPAYPPARRDNEAPPTPEVMAPMMMMMMMMTMMMMMMMVLMMMAMMTR
jgi:hypothetical protein